MIPAKHGRQGCFQLVKSPLVTDTAPLLRPSPLLVKAQSYLSCCTLFKFSIRLHLIHDSGNLALLSSSLGPPSSCRQRQRSPMQSQPRQVPSIPLADILGPILEARVCPVVSSVSSVLQLSRMDFGIFPYLADHNTIRSRRSPQIWAFIMSSKSRFCKLNCLGLLFRAV